MVFIISETILNKDLQVYQNVEENKMVSALRLSKVRIFWEGHKILWNLLITFVYSYTYRQK